jgi:hypothetical protein
VRRDLDPEEWPRVPRQLSRYRIVEIDGEAGLGAAREALERGLDGRARGELVLQVAGAAGPVAESAPP